MKLKNNALQELYDAVVNGTITISPHAESSIDKAFRECDEKIQKEIDIWNALEHEALSANKRLEEDISKLKEHIWDTCKILNNVISERDTLAKERDDLLSRTHCAEDEVERLRKAHDELFDAGSRKISELRRENEAVNKKLEEEINELKESLEKVNADRSELQNDRDSYHELYTELSKTYDKLSEDNKKLKARTDYLSYEVEWYLEDFLDVYKKWQEEKEKNRFDHMRDYLARFCKGRVCEACPLGSTKYKCGRGYSFKKATAWDSKIIPDEELEKYYEKARDLSHPMVGVNEAIKNACERFTKAVDATNVAFKENIACNSRECTFEATVEINNDLLEKVCGVKPKEEEHNLEYGDAVRVPWRDYDYMYIGRDKRGDGKMIRLFDPKNHNVVYVSSNNHLDIRGYKIIIGNEEDLRKIWCDKDADKE